MCGSTCCPTTVEYGGVTGSVVLDFVSDTDVVEYDMDRASIYNCKIKARFGLQFVGQHEAVVLVRAQ